MHVWAIEWFPAVTSKKCKLFILIKHCSALQMSMKNTVYRFLYNRELIVPYKQVFIHWSLWTMGIVGTGLLSIVGRLSLSRGLWYINIVSHEITCQLYTMRDIDMAGIYAPYHPRGCYTYCYMHVYWTSVMWRLFTIVTVYMLASSVLYRGYYPFTSFQFKNTGVHYKENTVHVYSSSANFVQSCFELSVHAMVLMAWWQSSTWQIYRLAHAIGCHKIPNTIINI